MNKVRVVKAVMLLLSAVAAVAPIIYALNMYSWDFQALFTPSYFPPKIDFRMEVASVRAEGNQLYATFKLTNLGEVEVEVEGLNATAYGPDGEALAPATLDKAVVSAPNSTENLVLKVSLDNTAINRLKSYFVERSHVNMEVRGEASMRVFGSRATVPITASFEINAADIETP